MRTKNNKGFTLVELLVAIGVFSILVAIGVGGFVNALHTQREVAAFIAVQSNASIALEQMAREIRTGDLFCNSPDNAADPACNDGILGPGTGCTLAVGTQGDTYTCDNRLDFYNAQGQNVDYELVPSSTDPALAGALTRSQNGPTGSFTPITGDNVNVVYLSFTIFGNTEGDHWNPRITIAMGVTPSSTDPAAESDVLNLQTTISAREIDCTQTGVISC